MTKTRTRQNNIIHGSKDTYRPNIIIALYAALKTAEQCVRALEVLYLFATFKRTGLSTMENAFRLCETCKGQHGMKQYNINGKTMIQDIVCAGSC